MGVGPPSSGARKGGSEVALMVAPRGDGGPPHQPPPTHRSLLLHTEGSEDVAGVGAGRMGRQNKGATGKKPLAPRWDT